MSEDTTISLELSRIQNKLKAPKGQLNKFGKYKYRSCEDILEAVKPLLKTCNVTVSDSIEYIGERYYIKASARITNSQGEWIEVTGFAREANSKKGMDESQITGAASSYARKYALNGLFAIDDTKDADTQDNRKKPNPAPVNNKLLNDLRDELNDKLEFVSETFKVKMLEYLNSAPDTVQTLQKAITRIETELNGEENGLEKN